MTAEPDEQEPDTVKRIRKGNDFEIADEPLANEPPAGEPPVGEPRLGEPPVGELPVNEPPVGEPPANERPLGAPLPEEALLDELLLDEPFGDDEASDLSAELAEPATNSAEDPLGWDDEDGDELGYAPLARAGRRPAWPSVFRIGVAALLAMAGLAVAATVLRSHRPGAAPPPSQRALADRRSRAAGGRVSPAVVSAWADPSQPAAAKPRRAHASHRTHHTRPRHHSPPPVAGTGAPAPRSSAPSPTPAASGGSRSAGSGGSRDFGFER